MNKKKSFLLELFRVGVFVLVFFLLFGFFHEITRRKAGHRVDIIHSSFDEKKNTIDVLCLGPSHAYSSFVPHVLWEEHGVTSLLAASASQTMLNAYYVLDEMLKYQKPKVLVMEAFSFVYQKPFSAEDKLRNITDNMPMGANRIRLIEGCLPDMELEEKRPGMCR